MTPREERQLRLAHTEVALQSRRRTLGGGTKGNLTDSSRRDKCNFPAGGVLEKMDEGNESSSCMAATVPRQWKRRDHRSMVFVMCGCVECIKALSVVDLARTRRSKNGKRKDQS